MKLQILSDLHNEFYRDGVVPSIESCDSDVIVLAGDIDVGASGVNWAKRESICQEKPVIYVAGNHEHYNNEYAANLKSMRTAAGNGVYFLENDSVEIDGTRFLGCTLWTDFSATGNQQIAMLTAASAFTDFQCIKFNSWLWDGFIRPEDILYIHQESKAWLKSELEKKFDGKTVVVTHFAPSLTCQHPGFALDHRSTYFLSSIDSLVEKADLWVFGHSHHCFDRIINGTRVVANQRGYPSECVNNFNPKAIIKL